VLPPFEVITAAANIFFEVFFETAEGGFFEAAAPGAAEGGFFEAANSAASQAWALSHAREALFFTTLTPATAAFDFRLTVELVAMEF
jgi:hypothetical protein